MIINATCVCTIHLVLHQKDLLIIMVTEYDREEDSIYKLILIAVHFSFF